MDAGFMQVLKLVGMVTIGIVVVLVITVSHFSGGNDMGRWVTGISTEGKVVVVFITPDQEKK